MNERILKLLAQTDIPQFPILGSLAWVATDHDMEKFAELIVKECLAIIQTEVSMKYKDGWEQHGVSDDWANGHYNASLHSRALLKRHFGVEE